MYCIKAHLRGPPPLTVDKNYSMILVHRHVIPNTYITMLNISWPNQSEMIYDIIQFMIDSKKEPFDSQFDLQFDNYDYNSIIGTLF